MFSDGSDLSQWLTQWARWMRINGIDLDFPHHGCGMEDALTNYAVSEDDSENYWLRHRVPIVVSIIDTCIDDLEPRHRDAIWFAYGVRRQKPDDIAYVYGQAFERLRDSVCRRIAIA